MRPYPLPLRQQIVRAVQDGTPKAVVAREYQIALSTVKRYVRQRERSGDLAPRPIPGRSPQIRPLDHPALEAQLAAHPAATLAEHCTHWERSRRAAVSSGTMARAIARLGYVRKRRPASPAP
jgi:transposase